jgi:type I restriction enzyme, S subunit
MVTDADNLDTSRLGSIRERLGRRLPADWKLTTLGEVFRWGSGGTPKRTDSRFYGGEIPWLVIGDLNDGMVADSATTITEDGLNESSAKWVEAGSVLLAMYGSIGKLGIAARRLTTNQAIAFTKPDPVHAKYLFYYLMYVRGDLASLGKGATQKNISQTVIKAFPFVLAPPDDQKRIVAEIERQFSRLDETVADLERVKANLKRYKAAVLKAAVEGRLVEPEGELARRDGGTYETGDQLLQRILLVRRGWTRTGRYREPATPNTSHLPKPPPGWTYASAEQLTDPNRPITYGVIKLGDPVPAGVPVLRSSDVRELRVDLDAVKRISPKIAEKYRRTFLAGGEILVTVRGTLGGIAVAPGECRGFNISREVAMLALVLPDMAPSTALFIASPPLHDWLMTRTAGIAYTGINIATLKALPIPIPPLAEQHRIVAAVERHLSMAGKLSDQTDVGLRRIERLRQAILHSAFSERAFGERSEAIAPLNTN